jgi:hypothetical protein
MIFLSYTLLLLATNAFISQEFKFDEISCPVASIFDGTSAENCSSCLMSKTTLADTCKCVQGYIQPFCDSNLACSEEEVLSFDNTFCVSCPGEKMEVSYNGNSRSYCACPVNQILGIISFLLC